MNKKRCKWIRNNNELMLSYHDNEWGRPLYNERKLFELLCLESMQGGLNWLTILKKRQNYQTFFHNFELNKVAHMTSDDVDMLMNETGIIRHRLKIESILNNAKCWLCLSKKISMVDHLWSFVGNRTLLNAYNTASDIPSKTEQSNAMSEYLKSNGFKFIGSTICYSFMQASGMVNDHTKECFLAYSKINMINDKFL